MLSKYLHRPPTEIDYFTNAEGKLLIQDGEIGFNLSHSSDKVAFIFGLRKQLGIDIEYIKPVDELAEIVNGFFSITEKKALEQIGPDTIIKKFFKIWTQKEAYVKAIGKGLAIPFRDFSVSVEDQPSLWLINDQKIAGMKMGVWSFTVGEDYQAAVCMPAETTREIRIFHGTIKCNNSGIDFGIKDSEEIGFSI